MHINIYLLISVSQHYKYTFVRLDMNIFDDMHFELYINRYILHYYLKCIIL